MLSPKDHETAERYRTMLRIGVPLGGVQQKMSVDGLSQEVVDSVLARHIVNACSTCRHSSISVTAQDHTNIENSMLPAIILAELSSICGDCIDMKELVQKILGIEARHKQIGDMLNEIERLHNDRRNTSQKREGELGSLSRLKEASVLFLTSPGVKENRRKGKQRRAAMRIQAVVRGFIQRVKYTKYLEHLHQLKIEKSVLIQKMIRGFLMQKIMRRKNHISLSILCRQCLIRNHLAAKRRKIKKRMWRLRKKQKKASVRIQTLARGFIQRTRYKKIFTRRPTYSIKDELAHMNQYLVEYKEKTKRLVEDAKFQYEQELVEYKESIEDKLHAEATNQQSIRDENIKIFQDLRKEHKELRQQRDRTWIGIKPLEKNVDRYQKGLKDANIHMVKLVMVDKKLGTANARLTKAVGQYERRMAKMEAFRKKQEALRLFEAQSRVRYQKTIARIVARIQDHYGEDVQLLEDIVNLVDGCRPDK